MLVSENCSLFLFLFVPFLMDKEHVIVLINLYLLKVFDEDLDTEPSNAATSVRKLVKDSKTCFEKLYKAISFILYLYYLTFYTFQCYQSWFNIPHKPCFVRTIL